MARVARAFVRDVDRGWKRVMQLAELLDKGESYTKVGLIGTEADEKPEGSDLTQAEIGAVHEYGSEDGRIPQRSWIGRAFDKHREQLLALARPMIGRVYDGQMTIEQALGILGARFSADIKNTVTREEPIPPPNSPAVAEKKALKGTRIIQGNRKREVNGRFAARIEVSGVRTLIDTARMIGSVTWAVIVTRKSAA